MAVLTEILPRIGAIDDDFWVAVSRLVRHSAHPLAVADPVIMAAECYRDWTAKGWVPSDLWVPS